MLMLNSAVDEHEALAKLPKERTGHAPGVSSNVGSYEYSRVSLPDSVVVNMVAERV